MNINPDLILSLFHIDINLLESEPIIEDRGLCIEIFVTLKDEINRECPYCHSHKINIDDNVYQRKKFNVIQNIGKPIYLVLYKRKYKCMECGHKYRQQTELCERKKKIPNPIHREIFDALSENVTYKYVAKLFGISVPEVLTIFDRMAHYQRQPLSAAISIDEKKFYTEQGNYVCIISDAITGDILDVFPGRTNDYIEDYFNKIPQKERENVKFIASDMYGGFKTLAKKFFPNAIHIIDFFHLKQEFIWGINKIRNEYQKSFNKDDLEYKILKNSWAHFLRDNTKPRVKKHKRLKRFNNTDDHKEHFYKDKNDKELTFKDALEVTLEKAPYLVELVNTYDDFNRYIIFGDTPEKVEYELNFIINKLKLSDCKHIQTIGSTFEKFKQEIINSYSSINYLHVSNAHAEGNNNLIEALIKNSYGLTHFNRFRNRIIHIKRHKKTGYF